MAKTIVLNKEDFNNPLHPHLWEGIMDDLDLPMETETVTLSVVVTDSE